MEDSKKEYHDVGILQAWLNYVRMVTLRHSMNVHYPLRNSVLVLLIFFRGFLLYAQPEPTRLSPGLIAEGDATSVLIKVSDSTEFVNWKNVYRNHWQIKSVGNRIFEVSGFIKHIEDEFKHARAVQIIDRNNRFALEETVFGEFDRTLNAITIAHALYPQINGSAMKLSVKEKPFNKDDIDLRGRVVLNNQFDEPATQHATFMASIAVGGGNTNTFAKGPAWAASVTTSDFSRLLPDEDKDIIAQNINVQNHSYGVGVENYYGIESSEYDRQVYALPSVLHIFSSGNEGNKSPIEGTYAGISGYANLTGQFKTSKNTISVGSSDKYGQVVTLSSRGPAHDGRIKPELIAFGDAGSSESAAVVSGVALLVQDVFKKKFNELPDAALVKAAMINGAIDSGRPQVDFESGFGNVNALNSVKAIEQEHFYSQIIRNGEENIFTVSVPEGQSELKISLVWSDPAAEPLVSRALVNDLDVILRHIPSGETWYPWILDSSPVISLLEKQAIRGIDRINNVEQITLNNPPAGDYEIHVRGFSVTSAGQKFFVVYDWFKNFEWINPHQGSSFSAGEKNVIRWVWRGSHESARIEYRLLPDGEWIVLAEDVDLMQQYHEWILPVLNANLQIKISNANFSFESSVFTISNPSPISVGYNCDDEIMLRWNRIPQADKYVINSLGEKYLEPFLVVTDTFAIIKISEIKTNYYAITPIINDLPGARDATIDYTQQGVDCYLVRFTSQEYLVNDVAKFDLVISSTYQLNSVSLERFDGSQYITIEEISPVNSTNFVFTDVKPLTGNNYYRAKIERNAKTAVLSDSVQIIHVTQTDLFAFPNPVHSGDELNVVIEDEANVVIRIFDLQGRLIRGTEDFGSVRSIDTSNLMAGIYFIRVYKQDGTSLVTKILIQ